MIEKSEKCVWIIFQEASSIGRGAYSRHYFFAQELKKKGYKVYIICASFHHFQFDKSNPSGLYNISETDDITTVRLKVNKYKQAHSPLRIVSWILFMLGLLGLPFLNLSKPQVIMVSTPSLHATIGARLLKQYFRKTKLVLEIRDIWPMTLNKIGGISTRNVLYKWMLKIEKGAYKSADEIISTLPRADLRIKKVLKHQPYKFTCIPQGYSPVETNSLNSEEYATLKEIKTNGSFLVGYAGTIGASNALETILGAAKELIKREELSIKIVIIGAGSHKKSLVDKAERLPNVHFLNRVDKSKLTLLLGEFDLLYDSTKKTELYNYGISRNKWMDYMVAARPIIASFSGYDQTLSNNFCGVYIEAENGIELAQNIISLRNQGKDYLDNLGLNGYNYVTKDRSFERLTTDLIKVFES